MAWIMGLRSMAHRQVPVVEALEEDLSTSRCAEPQAGLEAQFAMMVRDDVVKNVMVRFVLRFRGARYQCCFLSLVSQGAEVLFHLCRGYMSGRRFSVADPPRESGYSSATRPMTRGKRNATIPRSC